MPNSRIKNSVANAGIRGIIPNVRPANTERVAEIPSRTFGGAGYPIGILMAITYYRIQTVPAVPSRGALDRPHVMIRTN